MNRQYKEFKFNIRSLPLYEIGWDLMQGEIKG